MKFANADRLTVFQELTPVFQNVFDDDSISITDQTTAKDIDQWDSLNHINLVVAVEQKFGVKFNTAEVARLANVGEFVDSIVKKLKS